MSLHSWEYLEAVTGSPPRTKKLRHYLQSDSDVMCCKSPKTSRRPQKPRQGDQLIHRRYIKSSPQQTSFSFRFGARSKLYCIVLYLYIYIALVAVHTNQKRFQCERPREKRAVLRERKEALGSPVNKVDRVEGRSWFQSEGPMIAKGNPGRSSRREGTVVTGGCGGHIVAQE